MKMMHHDNNKK